MTAASLARSRGARVGVRTVVSLLAGRSFYRLAYQAGNVTLVALWGSTTFGDYAATLGICGWLMFVGVAVEKTALKLMPRSHSLTPRLARLCLALAGIPLLMCLAALAVGATLRPHSHLTLYLVAAVWFTACGALMVLAALHRLAGRPDRDRRAFAALAVAILASLVLTWSLRLPPVGQLAMIMTAAGALVLGLARALPPAWRQHPATRRRAPVLRAVLRTTIMLGAFELTSALAVTVVYATLAVAGRGDQTTLFYLAALASSSAAGALIYGLRIAQPRVSRRQRGARAAGGRAQARRALNLSAAGGFALGLTLAIYAASEHARPAGIVMLAAVTGAEIILFTIVAYATFLLENTEARALRITSGSAVAGLALTVALSVPLISRFGAAGAMATLGLAVAGQGTVMSILLFARYGRSSRWCRRAQRANDRRYRRAVAAAFATVPYYREWWLETGLRTPTHVATAELRREDLAPLSHGSDDMREPDYGLRASRRLGVADLAQIFGQRHDPRLALPPDATPGATAYDRLLGYVAVFGTCGQWHVAVPDFYVREAPGGVAFTALRRRDLRLIDIQLGTHVAVRLDSCPRHGTPVLRT